MRDPYEILGIERSAGADEIKSSYRKLAMKHHPDRNPGDEEAAAKFKEAAEAYAILGDAEKKALYDRHGFDGLRGANMPNTGNMDDLFSAFGDILGDFFGGGRGGRGRQGGRDLLYQVEITLIEAARGCKKTLNYPREENCPECNGSGARKGSSPAKCRQCGGSGAQVIAQGFFRVQQTCRACGGAGVIITDPCTHCRGRARVQVQRTIDISIPPGSFTGLRLKVGGEGEAGSPGAPRGDLVCEIHVQDHPLFHRQDEHLICEVPITFSQAALGAEIEVPTLDGPHAHKFKAGVQTGEKIRISGKGMPNLRTGRNGDLYVIVRVETPRNLTKRQEELFRELADLDHKNVSAERKSFFDQIKEFFTGSTKEDEKKES